MNHELNRRLTLPLFYACPGLPPSSFSLRVLHDARTHARTQQLKQRTTHAFQEVSVLRAELERTEAAVVGGKKKRDIDIAAREAQLRQCEEEIRMLKAEVCVGVVYSLIILHIRAV